MSVFKKISCVLFLGFLSIMNANAQSDEIQWLSFEQLEDSLSIKPKKVIIDFYADWCSFCKKMDKVGFKNKDVIQRIKENYYAVKMNAETTDTISFGGQQFVNKEVGKRRRANHEIALLLGSRENYPFSLPVIVVLDESFKVSSRHFQYLSPKNMLEVFTE